MGTILREWIFDFCLFFFDFLAPICLNLWKKHHTAPLLTCDSRVLIHTATFELLREGVKPFELRYCLLALELLSFCCGRWKREDCVSSCGCGCGCGCQIILESKKYFVLDWKIFLLKKSFNKNYITVDLLRLQNWPCSFQVFFFIDLGGKREKTSTSGSSLFI